MSLQLITSIKTVHNSWINLICELKDKRLVSCSVNCSMVIYSKFYEVQFYIKYAHEHAIYSLCTLRNGDLASSSYKEIKIWKINQNDYQLICILSGHDDFVRKVIEMEDGKMCSCSTDKTITIWDNNQCVKTLYGHTNYVMSIIEMGKYIVSASKDKTLRMWDKSTYQSITIIENVECCSNSSLSKLNDKTLLVGGNNTIYLVDIETYQINIFKSRSSEAFQCFSVLRNGSVLVGNGRGEILCYEPSSNKIIFRKKYHKGGISCFIRTEDNKLVSSSLDQTIKIYIYYY